MIIEDYIMEVNKVRRIFNEILITENMTGNKWVILEFINRTENATAKDIRQEFLMNKTTVSQIIKEMVNHNMVEVKRDFNDRRNKIISVTQTGHENLNALEDLKVELTKELGLDYFVEQTKVMRDTRIAIEKIKEKMS